MVWFAAICKGGGQDYGNAWIFALILFALRFVGISLTPQMTLLEIYREVSCFRTVQLGSKLAASHISRYQNFRWLTVYAFFVHAIWYLYFKCCFCTLFLYLIILSFPFLRNSWKERLVQSLKNRGAAIHAACLTRCRHAIFCEMLELSLYVCAKARAIHG